MPRVRGTTAATSGRESWLIFFFLVQERFQETHNPAPSSYYNVTLIPAALDMTSSSGPRALAKSSRPVYLFSHPQTREEIC